MTNIIRHDPLRSLFAFPRFFDDMDEAMTQRGLKIRETEKELIAEAVIAGVPSNDVEVHIEDGILTIKAEAKEEHVSYSYYYTAALSGGQWDKANAEVKHGVVTVTIPKTEASRPRKIEVKAREE